MAGRKRADGEGTITQREDGTWMGQISLGHKPDGKRNRPTVYGKTQKEVRERLDALKRSHADGTLSHTKLTVAQFLEHWLNEACRGLKPSSREQYEFCVYKHIVPRIGRTRLNKLTALQVQTMMNQVTDAISQKPGATGVATANKCRVVLLCAYKQAIRWQQATYNPVEAVDPLPETPRDMQLWEPEQAARFLDVAMAHRLYPLFYLAMSSGMRRGELIGLQWQSVREHIIVVEDTLVKVHGKLIEGTPKGRKGKKKTRSVAITPDVVSVLKEHRQRQLAERELFGDDWPDSELVFTSEWGTPLNPDNLRRLYHRLMDKAEVPRICLHEMRHLHSSVCINSGMDPKKLADRLGHSRASFTMDRYTHLFESQRATSAVSLLEFLPKADPEDLN